MSSPEAGAKEASKARLRQSLAGNILTKLFKLPREERLLADYSCAYKGKILLHGRMYVTTSSVCFYSSIFGHETRKVLPYRFVTGIHKRKNALVIPGVEICVDVRGDKRKYCFCSFFAGALNSNSGSSIPDSALEATAGAGASSPLSMEGSMPTAVGTAAVAVTGRSGAGSLPATRAGSRRATLGPEVLGGAATTDDDPDHDDDDEEEVVDSGSGPEPGEEEDYSTGANEDEDDEEANLAPVPAAVLGQFEEMEVVAEEELDIEVDDFFREFLADEAPQGWGELHRDQGCTEMSVGQWAEVETADEHRLGRTFRFKMPLNIPFAPKETRVEKTESFVRFAGPTLVKDVSARSFDVPFGDCFTTEDRWIINPIPPDAGQEDPPPGAGRCRIRVAARVVFSKSTMFKRMIETRAVEGIKEATRQFFDSFARPHIIATQDRRLAEAQARAEEAEASKRRLSSRARRRRRRREQREDEEAMSRIASHPTPSRILPSGLAMLPPASQPVGSTAAAPAPTPATAAAGDKASGGGSQPGDLRLPTPECIGQLERSELEAVYGRLWHYRSSQLRRSVASRATSAFSAHKDRTGASAEEPEIAFTIPGVGWSCSRDGLHQAATAPLLWFVLGILAMLLLSSWRQSPWPATVGLADVGLSPPLGSSVEPDTQAEPPASFASSWAVWPTWPSYGQAEAPAPQPTAAAKGAARSGQMEPPGADNTEALLEALTARVLERLDRRQPTAAATEEVVAELPPQPLGG